MLPIDRREYLRYLSALTGGSALTSGVVGQSGVASADTGVQAPSDLMVEYSEAPNNVPVLTDPVTSDEQEPFGPRFSWRVPTAERGGRQSAYRVLVASSPELLAREFGDVWDSGRVESGRSTNVTFQPERILGPDETYYWKVRVWDADGNGSPWSKPARFTTAIPDSPDQWAGTWIGLDDPVPMHEPSDVGPVGNRDSPLLRTELTLDKPVRRARAHVLTLGWGEMYINGERVGDDQLNPAWTRYEDRSLYATYDVEHLLSAGENALGLWLGRGWFSKTAEVPAGILAAGDAPDEISPAIASAHVPQYPTSPLSQWTSHGAPRALLQVNVEHEDGTTESIVTDDSWQAAPSPVTDNDIWDGEHYNALLEQPGWATSGFDATAWVSATELGEPSHWRDVGGASDPALRPMRTQAIEVTETLDPVEIYEFEGDHIVDLGQNFAGWIELTVRGALEGERIVMEYAEVLKENGDIDQRNLRSAEATDAYTAKGADEEVYEPRFTYHGFRYVKIQNYPGDLAAEDVVGKVVHTAFEKRGSFACSNEELNQVQHNSVWGLRSNAHSIPTDCPQRDERMGWTGDAHMTANADLYNFDAVRFYEKWMHDHANAQADAGGQADTVPWVYGTNPGDPNWGKTQVVVPWSMYRHTGDEQLLETYYGDMRAYVDFWHEEADDHVIPERSINYGDWLAPEGQRRDTRLVATFAHYQTTEMVADAADALGRSGEANVLRKRVDAIAEAFNDEFFDPETNTYGSGLQKSYALPVYLGIVPDDREEAVLRNFVEKIKTEDGGRLKTGFVATRPLIYGLADNGYEELAYHIVNQPEYPGWVYMVHNGATTMWERWNSDEGAPEMNSYNHRPWALVSEWFYERLAGINIGAPGFEHAEIAPMVVEDLEWAEASVDTARGDVASRWEKTDDGLESNVAIPWNSTGTVRIPDLGSESVRVTEGGRVIWDDRSGSSNTDGHQGITAVRRTEEAVVVEVEAGEYTFVSSGDPSSKEDRVFDKRSIVSGSRADEGSVFTGGQTNRIELTTEASDRVVVRDAVPDEWSVVAGDEHRIYETDGTKYVEFTERVEEASRTYFAEAPSGLQGTNQYTFGPVEVLADDEWQTLVGTTATYTVVGPSTDT
jgi:hypothetical protein